MEGSIFVMQPDNSLVKVNRTPYNSEALLQGLLSYYPDLLAGDQMNTENPRRWLLISPELSLGTEADGTGGWWIDHLFLDQDAIPTIAEVKRSSDSRIRREVVGQMLDYAAHLEVYWPAERIRAYFEERCRAQGTDPNLKVSELVQEEEIDIEVFWARVGENLFIGKMRLLFVADEMPMHLQRVVEFLNKNMAPIEVLAVEIKQFEGSNLKTLVPRVLGQTVQTQEKKAKATSASVSQRQWDEQQFMEAFSIRNGPAEMNAVRQIIDWSKSIGILWGKGKRDDRGSFYPELIHDGLKHYIFGVWTSGGFELQFERMKARPPFDQENLRAEFASLLEQIPGMPPMPADVLGRRPSFPLSLLAVGSNLDQFLSACDWYCEKVRSS
ncbi:MAG: hypothetical protein ACR2JW_05825 [Thermomicrobiales bacterium]